MWDQSSGQTVAQFVSPKRVPCSAYILCGRTTNNRRSTRIRVVKRWIGGKGSIRSKNEATRLSFPDPPRDPPRRTSGMAFHPRWMYNMPSESENSIEKGYQQDQIEIKEAAKKCLTDHHSKREALCATLTGDLQLKWGSVEWEWSGGIGLPGKRP